MSSSRVPISEITSPVGIAHAIRAREVKRHVAITALESGTLENGKRVTPNRKARLNYSLTELDRELRELYAKRDALPSASKSTAQGASLAKAAAPTPTASNIADWE